MVTVKCPDNGVDPAFVTTAVDVAVAAWHTGAVQPPVAMASSVSEDVSVMALGMYQAPVGTLLGFWRKVMLHVIAPYCGQGGYTLCNDGIRPHTHTQCVHMSNVRRVTSKTIRACEDLALDRHQTTFTSPQVSSTHLVLL